MAWSRQAQPCNKLIWATPHDTPPTLHQAYSKADWERHVTWRRYIPEVQISAVVVLTLLPLIAWSVFVSACVGLYATFLAPHGWPQVTNHPDFIVPFTLTSFALSLLLLYKTNSAYQRWWEARTQLGTLYIVSRSLTRLVRSLGPGLGVI